MWQRSRIKFPTRGRPGSFQFLLDIPSSQTFRLTLWIVAADNELGEIRLITDLQVSGEVLTHTHAQVLTAHRKDSPNDIKVTDTFSAVIIKLVVCSMEEKKDENSIFKKAGDEYPCRATCCSMSQLKSADFQKTYFQTTHCVSPQVLPVSLFLLSVMLLNYLPVWREPQARLYFQSWVWKTSVGFQDIGSKLINSSQISTLRYLSTQFSLLLLFSHWTKACVSTCRFLVMAKSLAFDWKALEMW